jgi:hypothetical protein
MPPNPSSTLNPPSSPRAKRVPIAPVQKWALTGTNFTGPREDVAATIEGLQSIPDEWAVALIATISALKPSVRGLKLNISFTCDGEEFHINGHAQKIY